MLCKACGSEKIRIVDSRYADRLNGKLRRRECRDCGARFTTIEVAWGDVDRLIEDQIPVKVKCAIGNGALPPLHRSVIETFVAEKMDVQYTARALQESRLSIEYCIDRIRDMTGLDPMKFDDLAILLALIRREEK